VRRVIVKRHVSGSRLGAVRLEDKHPSGYQNPEGFIDEINKTAKRKMINDMKSGNGTPTCTI
jgi:hypothetical protein